MDSSDLLQLTIAGFCSDLHEACSLTLHYEAAAFRKMDDLAEPPQTVAVTPAGGHRKVRTVYKLRYLRKKFAANEIILSKKLDMTNGMNCVQLLDEDVPCTDFKVGAGKMKRVKRPPEAVDHWFSSKHP